MSEIQEVTPAYNELEKFLNPFQFKLITVAILPQTENASLIPTAHFDLKNRIRAVTPEVFFGTAPNGEAKAAFQLELQSAQHNGFGVYFTMNEGNGLAVPDSDNLNCGKRTNITKLKTLAIDTDDADARALEAELIKLKLTPTFIIETSPNRYHFYFLLDTAQAESENLWMWEALQKKLASLVPKLDQSLADINQLLRLPTFYNLKKRPFHKIRVIKSYDTSYNLKDLYDRLEAHHFNPVLNGSAGGVNGHYKTPIVNGKATWNKFEFPRAIQSLQSGSRRDTICSYIEHTMENTLPLTAKDDDYWTLIDAFILKYLTPSDAIDFLPGGKRRKNIETYFEDQKRYRIKKKHSIESAQSIKNFDHTEAIDEGKLPDDFYLNFPGDLGFITSEIHNHSPKMAVEICFAGALCISGALKADTYRYNGAWPLINGIIIAGTGAGKSELKSCIYEILQKAGMTGPYSQLLDFQNTVQSLHEKLYTAGGVGTTIIDEAGDYLQILNSKNAPGYVKALRKYFKEATTGSGKGTRLSAGGSLSFRIPAIQYGFLSIWAFIQPGKFEDSLSIDDMSDGFLPRFFTFNGHSNIDLLSTYDGIRRDTFNVGIELTVLIESLAGKSALLDSRSLKPTLDTAQEEALRLNKKCKKQDIAEQQREAVYTARSEARLMGDKVEVTLSPEAEELVRGYLYEQQRKAEQLKKANTNDPALAIYIRMEEMLNRLICNSATSTVVDYDTAQACIKFHRFQTDRFFATELKELTKSDSDKVHDAVISGLKRAFKKKGEAVTVREISQSMAGRNKPKNLSQVLQELVKQNEIWIQERPHKLIKDKTITVYLPAIQEDQI